MSASSASHLTGGPGLGSSKIDASEIAHSPFDLFSPPPTEKYIKGGSTKFYHPFVALKSEGPIQFNVTPSDRYIHLPSTRLYGSFKVVKISLCFVFGSFI